MINSMITPSSIVGTEWNSTQLKLKTAQLNTTLLTDQLFSEVLPLTMLISSHQPFIVHMKVYTDDIVLHCSSK